LTPEGTAVPREVVVVLGPTASGKSQVACALARRFGGWILSVDSMTVYRGLEIGTSKPPEAIRREIPHRGLNLSEPDQDFSLGDFLRAADTALVEMGEAGALPILVGGTGLYLRGVLKGIAPLPKRDEGYRRSLLDRERREGPGALHRMLREVDPSSASRIAPADVQRLVRALELAREGVRDALGKPGAEWSGPDRMRSIKVGLRRDGRELEGRIGERVEGFLARGLLEETRNLLLKYPASGNAFKALGYRELARHLRGECDLEAAREEMVRNTIRYAKRQMTWFRKEPGVKWFDLSGPAEAAAPLIGDHVAGCLGGKAAAAEQSRGQVR